MFGELQSKWTIWQTDHALTNHCGKSTFWLKFPQDCFIWFRGYFVVLKH